MDIYVGLWIFVIIVVTLISLLSYDNGDEVMKDFYNLEVIPGKSSDNLLVDIREILKKHGLNYKAVAYCFYIPSSHCIVDMDETNHYAFEIYDNKTLVYTIETHPKKIFRKIKVTMGA